MVQEHGTPGCGLSGKAPTSLSSQAMRPLRTPLPTVLSRCSLSASLQRLAQQPAPPCRPFSASYGRCPSSRSLPQITPRPPDRSLPLCTTQQTPRHQLHQCHRFSHHDALSQTLSRHDRQHRAEWHHGLLSCHLPPTLGSASPSQPPILAGTKWSSLLLWICGFGLGSFYGRLSLFRFFSVRGFLCSRYYLLLFL